MGTGQPRAIVFEKFQPISGILANNFSKTNTFSTLHMTKSGEVVMVRDIKMDHRLVSTYIKKYTNYKKGTPITLMSCFTGVGRNSVAQKLANKMGVPVTAPNMQIITERRLFGDRIVIGELADVAMDDVSINVYKRKGKFITFYPGEGLGAEKGRRVKSVDTKSISTNTPKGIECIAPLVLPSTDLYFGPNVVNKDELPFVDPSKNDDGEWNRGCQSNDMNFISESDPVNKEYAFAKVNILYKNKKCPLSILVHGEKTYITLNNISEIKDALTYNQEREFRENGKLNINAKEFASILKKSKKYNSNPSKHIHLFSCNTGCLPNGFAAELSKELNVNVTAFSGYAYIIPKKGVFATSSGGFDVRGNFVAYDKASIKTFIPESDLSKEHNLYSNVYLK